MYNDYKITLRQAITSPNINLSEDLDQEETTLIDILKRKYSSDLLSYCDYVEEILKEQTERFTCPIGSESKLESFMKDLPLSNI